MQTTLNFLTLVFWFCLILVLVESYNFIKILLITELIWVLLYTNTIYIGLVIDNAELLSFSLLLLGVAGLEYSTALVVVLVYKNIYNLVSFNDNNLKR